MKIWELGNVGMSVTHRQKVSKTRRGAGRPKTTARVQLDASTFVCLRSGTEVELVYIPEDTQRRFGLPVEVKAIFKMDDWWRRDVFVLNNGRKALLRKLQEGQVVRVLSVTETAGRTKPPVWEEAKNLNPEGASRKDSDASVSHRR